MGFDCVSIECELCKKDFNLLDFDDPLNMKEYIIMGSCPQCQHLIFDPKYCISELLGVIPKGRLIIDEKIWNKPDLPKGFTLTILERLEKMD